MTSSSDCRGSPASTPCHLLVLLCCCKGPKAGSSMPSGLCHMSGLKVVFTILSLVATCPALLMLLSYEQGPVLIRQSVIQQAKSWLPDVNRFHVFAYGNSTESRNVSLFDAKPKNESEKIEVKLGVPPKDVPVKSDVKISKETKSEVKPKNESKAEVKPDVKSKTQKAKPDVQPQTEPAKPEVKTESKTEVKPGSEVKAKTDTPKADDMPTVESLPLVVPGDQEHLCPETPPGLVGHIPVDQKEYSIESINQKFTADRPGGHFRPRDCVARAKVAIIIPYRDRKSHLMVFLNNVIPFMIKQQAEFAIYIIEPVPALTFNRALLMNIGYVEALKANYTCFIFHDVDLIPENDKNMYRCGANPRHLSVASSKWKYRLPYPTNAGGIIAMTSKIYEDVNGHSNLFFGWGGEDDDLSTRLRRKGYKLRRYSVTIGRYQALRHGQDKGNPKNPLRSKLLVGKGRNPKEDGLSSLKYSVVKSENYPLYTWFLIDVDMNYYNKTIHEFRQKNNF